jgi:hypothetical protein
MVTVIAISFIVICIVVPMIMFLGKQISVTSWAQREGARRADAMMSKDLAWLDQHNTKR